ncbi:MAG: hypothetical protein OMM_11987, partial [Candidatus Magnetoglobus multicellularis str. Araruama]
MSLIKYIPDSVDQITGVTDTSLSIPTDQRVLGSDTVCYMVTDDYRTGKYNNVTGKLAESEQLLTSGNTTDIVLTQNSAKNKVYALADSDPIKLFEIQTSDMSTLNEYGVGINPEIPTGYLSYYKMNGDVTDETGNFNGTNNGATLTNDKDGNPNSAY